MTTTESIDLTLHFSIEDVPGEDWHDVVLRAIGPRKQWPPRKTPETFEEALRMTPVPLPFDAICGSCSPRSRSPILCDACTVEANIADVGPEPWLKGIGVPMTPGDYVLRGHMTWRADEPDSWSGLFVATSLGPRPTPEVGRHGSQALQSFVGRNVLIGFELPDGGQEHLWVEVTALSKEDGAELEGALDDSPKLRVDFKARDAVVFSRSEIADVL